MDEKYLPWEEDGLVFLPGDWEIERADVEGLYNYTIGGIRGACSVDGVQLIDWHMARLVNYTMLTPWSNSGIEFSDTTEVARDVSDFDDNESERKYLVFVGKKLMRVNKYYLVKNEMAVASDALKRKVSQQVIRSNKYNKACKPWVSDDILIPALPSGVTVERAGAEGMYKVRQPGSMSVWSAARLVEEKYALDGYTVKLEDMCESEKTTLSSLKDGTRGFWLCDHPNAVKTLRDIAKLWNELEMGYSGKLAGKIMSHNRNIYVACSKKESSLDGYDAKLTALDREFNNYSDMLKRLEEIVNELKPFGDMRINNYFGDYYTLKDKYIAARDDVDAAKQKIIRQAQNIKVELDGVDYGDDDTDVFPIDILPPSLQDIMREEYEKILSFNDQFDEKCENIKACADGYFKMLDDDKAKYDRLVAEFSSIDDVIRGLERRRYELDNAKNELDDKLLHKKPMIAQKDRHSGIKLITKVKVTIDGDGEFTVYDRNKRGFTVTAEELVYMGLAEYIK